MGLAILLLRERPNRYQVAGATVAFAGIGAIGLERLQPAALLPLLMTIGAAFFWGVGNILSKRAGRIDMLGFVVWSSLVPPLPLLALSLLFEGMPAIAQVPGSLSWLGLGSVLFIAYGATLFGYFAWNLLLSRYPAGLVAPFSLLVPIVGFGSAALLLGESISAPEVAGSLLVLLGLAIHVLGPRWAARRRASGRLEQDG